MSRTGTPGSGTLAHPSTPSGEYKLKPANIMFDPRVVRGNTWAASTLAKLKEVQAPATPTKPAATRCLTHQAPMGPCLPAAPDSVRLCDELHLTGWTTSCWTVYFCALADMSKVCSLTA